MPVGCTLMLDTTLRPAKDRILAPLVRGPIGAVPPIVLSVVGLAVSLAAAGAAWAGMTALAVVAWLLGRVADGLDGAVARARGRASDAGGLLDFTVDAVGYAAIPLGIAAGVDERATWIVVAVVIATFYVNAVTLGYTSALVEKRGRADAGPASAAIPRGLVEGTETIVFFTIALAVPGAADVTLGVMAAAVAVTAAERVLWARREFA